MGRRTDQHHVDVRSLHRRLPIPVAAHWVSPASRSAASQLTSATAANSASSNRLSAAARRWPWRPAPIIATLILFTTDNPCLLALSCGGYRCPTTVSIKPLRNPPPVVPQEADQPAGQTVGLRGREKDRQLGDLFRGHAAFLLLLDGPGQKVLTGRLAGLQDLLQEFGIYGTRSDGINIDVVLLDLFARVSVSRTTAAFEAA